MKISEIYKALDMAVPFSTQESYDNSGFLVGNPDASVSRVLLALDITIPVIREAESRGAQLIISHHPVIWEPLKSLTPAHPAYHLAAAGIGAICMHTCLDLAKGGVDDHLYDAIKPALDLEAQGEFLKPLPSGLGYGHLCRLQTPLSAAEAAARLKEALSCGCVRYYDSGNPIGVLTYCCGSGGSLLELAVEQGADAFVTGDVKHDVFMQAQNLGISLFDCGHFHTEAPVLPYLQQLLQQIIPELEVIFSQTGSGIAYQ